MGGMYDPKTGEIVWEFHVPPDEQRVYYAAHPPVALSGVTCTSIEPPDWRFDGHGEPVNAVFQLSCRCGSALFTVVGRSEDDEVCGPIWLACSGCGDEQRIFDPSVHGYDAAHSRGDDVGGAGERADLIDPDVPPPHHVIIRFEYPSDLLGDAAFAGREADLFSWITVLARAPRTGALAQLFDRECA